MSHGQRRRRTNPTSLFAVATAALVAVPRGTRAEVVEDACAAAAEDGQRARLAGKLRAARERFAKCSADACKPLIRQDCGQWAAEIDASMPSIVIDAKDGTEDVADVTVRVDGEVLTTNLDGKAIAIDPGPHRLTFERRGRLAIARDVIVREGVRSRVVEVRFLPDETPPRTEAAPPPDSAPARETAGGGHTLAPWILVAVGGATVATGVLFLVLRPQVPPNCNPDTGSCDFRENFSADGTPLTPSQRVTPANATPAQTDQLRKDQDTAGVHDGRTRVGVIGLVVGGALVTGGLVWHFAEPTARSRGSAIAPWVGPKGAGASAAWTF